MEPIPAYIYIVFILTTLITILFFFMASGSNKRTLIILFTWIGLQGILAYSGFYTVTQTLPPRFLLLVVPPLMLILYLFNSQHGKVYLDNFNMNTLTLLHIVRIPVELVLFWLFIHQAVPALMTFEGRNVDILSGITAPFVYYFGFVKKRWHKNILILWNVICLVLLFNIVLHAMLSAPTPLQQLAFDQPNKAVFFFPFVWLPCCIVPLVLFAHLTSLRHLLKS